MAMDLQGGQFKNLRNRLNRISGQVKGISKMLGEREYTDILNQILAARNALNQVALMILKNYTKECVRAIEAGQLTTEEIEKLLDSYAKLT